MTITTDAGVLDAASPPPSDAGDTSIPDAGPLTPPAELVHYLTGSDIDIQASPQGPGLILMGGSREVDAAFEWWVPRIAGGDIVILRTSGSDGYNDYLYSEIGGADSVKTMLVTSRELANDPYVANQIRNAEGIFLAGGDQSTYLANWKDTATEDALNYAWQRGAIIGGTSAGLAVLGEFIFAAYEGSIDSETALSDPFHPRVALEQGFLNFAPLKNIITDSHFGQRDRMGRLVSFLARLSTSYGAVNPIGLGIDERTALVIDSSSRGLVMGQGYIYLVRSLSAPEICIEGQPLTHTGLDYVRLSNGDQIQFPVDTNQTSNQSMAVNNGVLTPRQPY